LEAIGGLAGWLSFFVYRCLRLNEVQP